MVVALLSAGFVGWVDLAARRGLGTPVVTGTEALSGLWEEVCMTLSGYECGVRDLGRVKLTCFVEEEGFRVDGGLETEVGLDEPTRLTWGTLPEMLLPWGGRLAVVDLGSCASLADLGLVTKVAFARRGPGVLAGECELGEAPLEALADGFAPGADDLAVRT